MLRIREDGSVHVRMLLGPAGSGKTFQCLEDIRQELADSPEGPPLVFVTPKPGTYQVERQLLSGSLVGYTRLHILSFERLADFVLQQLGTPESPVLEEQGKTMLIRSLLPRYSQSLKLFHASARQNGFAQQLGRVFSDVQRARLCPEDLRVLSSKLGRAHPSTALKLHDISILMEAYLKQVEKHGLRDAESRIDAAALALHAAVGEHPSGAGMRFGGLWVDGFMEFAPQQLELLSAVAGVSSKVTIALCLDHVPHPGRACSWLSQWSASSSAYLQAQKHFRNAGIEVETFLLPRRSVEGRFENAALGYLERNWSHLQHELPAPEQEVVSKAVRILGCADRETEARECAREILRYVQAGGRYREIMVLVRNLEPYHDVFARVLSRYGIPFFLDRRESVAHHPLAEVTRSVLRVLACGWNQEDLFAAAKTGLFAVDEEEVDLLENEALSRGWEGEVWLNALPAARDGSQRRDSENHERLERARKAMVSPIDELRRKLEGMDGGPSGLELADALASFWEALQVEATLEDWAGEVVSGGIPPAAHRTVWEQALGWLQNLRLAFSGDRLSLRNWLPIVESGLSALTVGVIPPALDQVVIGAMDRSRTPDVNLVLLPGWNEGLFPSSLTQDVLLTDLDREAFAGQDIVLGSTRKAHAGRERYLAYIASTRARQRVVITFARHDSAGSPLNPSLLTNTIRRLFPDIPEETAPGERPAWEAMHASELSTYWLKHAQSERKDDQSVWSRLALSPGLQELTTSLAELHPPRAEEKLNPDLAAALYGPVFPTSVSRLEIFAACPFRFFVSSGLRAEERKRFELDAREQGSFQHEVLRQFHEDLVAEKKRWRELTTAEARDRVQRAANTVEANYRDGMTRRSPQAQFQATCMVAALQELIEILVEYMHGQYDFDPLLVEAEFGDDAPYPGWRVPLESGATLLLRGRIDRIDTCPHPEDPSRSLCVVVDYKSSQKRLDQVMIENGLQLQLLSYLNVLRQWRGVCRDRGLPELVPAGVFYIPLQGVYKSSSNRAEALSAAADARKVAYQHQGRFDVSYLKQFDHRGVSKGDQFNYQLKKDGQPYAKSVAAMSSDAFGQLLELMESLLREMGDRIYAGEISVSPYKRSNETACEHCICSPVCRIDPWMHRYRALAPRAEGRKQP